MLNESCVGGINSARGKVLADVACILATCEGQDLIDAIQRRRDGVGGFVFNLVENLDVQGELDGNWGEKWINAAAAGGQPLIDALVGLGFTKGTEALNNAYKNAQSWVSG